MNETLKNIALAAVVAVLVFLAVAFIMWDMDVAHWRKGQRAGLLGMCTICAAAAVAIRNVKHLS